MIWRVTILWKALVRAISGVLLFLAILLLEICTRCKIYVLPEALYHVGLSLWPENAPGFWSHLGFIFEKQRNLERSTDCYLRAAKLEPREAMHFWDLGTVYECQGKQSRAIENYTKALLMGEKLGEDFMSEVKARLDRLQRAES
jgi:tetratricopeptide (TPR) repeat protein